MISFEAFSDEMEKIAKSGKAVSWVGKHLKGIGRNLKGAATDLMSPVKSVKREVGSAKKDIESALSGKKKHPLDISKKGRSNKARNRRLLGHGLNLGMTGLMAHSALKKDDETGEGQSRTKRIARLAGSTLGGLATARRGFTGGILGSVVGDQAGKLVGSAADKVMKHKSKNEA